MPALEKAAHRLNDIHAPYRVYKSDISYFSGKLEAYLRYKAIPHSTIDANMKNMRAVAENTGYKKMPAVHTADDKWLFDTTPMLQWFEQRYRQAPILPKDPALRFVALLLEDYGDEWLWRPAMWWRWQPRASRWALGWRIASEMAHPGLGRPLGFLFGRRQLKEWLWDDGVTPENEGDVRDMLFRELEFLEPVLADQPYLLGSHPSAADFGYFGPMFRHFGNDPESGEVVRRRGPNTYEWMARLWNAKINKLPAEQHWVWPQSEHWAPLLERIARDYLPYLHQNAVTFRNNQQRFDYIGKTFTFKGTKVTNYRVHCRQVLQQEFNALNKHDQHRVDQLFEPSGGLEHLHINGTIDSGMADHFALPRDPASTHGNRPGFMKSLIGQPRN
ncbi:MAG: glutathione S-transferase family protein [Pseudomonas sp.]